MLFAPSNKQVGVCLANGVVLRISANWPCHMEFLCLHSLLRATDATTGLKLFLTLVANQPVRRLLFYILKHESVAKTVAVL